MFININQLVIRILYFIQGVFFKKDNFCPYCFSAGHKVIFKKKGLVDIYQCLNCFLYWTNPIFRFWGLYGFLYKEKDLVTNFPAHNKLNNLLNECLKDTGKDYTKVIKYFTERYNIKKALDFGSSWGYFLYQLGLFNIESAGVEVSDRRRKFGIRKLKLKIEKRLDSLIKEKEKFDIIFCLHTLEHLPNIRNIFRIFFELLSNEGIIVLEIPHLGLEERRTFEIMGAVHPLGFTKEFFLKNLPKEGFTAYVYEGYKDLVNDFQDVGRNLVVLGIKNN